MAESAEKAENILGWLADQVSGDEIEHVTTEMLERIINGQLQGEGTSAMFCKCLAILKVEQ